METVVIFALLAAVAYLLLYVRSRMYKREPFYEEVRDGSLQVAAPEDEQNRPL